FFRHALVARQEPTIGYHSTLNSGGGRVGDQTDDLRVNQELTTLQGHVANSAPAKDLQRPSIVIGRRASGLTSYSLFSREAAKVKSSVAEISYGAIAHRKHH